MSSLSLMSSKLSGENYLDVLSWNLNYVVHIALLSREENVKEKNKTEWKRRTFSKKYETVIFAISCIGSCLDAFSWDLVTVKFIEDWRIDEKMRNLWKIWGKQPSKVLPTGSLKLFLARESLVFTGWQIHRSGSALITTRFNMPEHEGKSQTILGFYLNSWVWYGSGDRRPGEVGSDLSLFRFLPFFFALGAALEFSMINWTVRS